MFTLWRWAMLSNLVQMCWFEIANIKKATVISASTLGNDHSGNVSVIILSKNNRHVCMSTPCHFSGGQNDVNVILGPTLLKRFRIRIKIRQHPNCSKTFNLKYREQSRAHTSLPLTQFQACRFTFVDVIAIWISNI